MASKKDLVNLINMSEPDELMRNIRKVRSSCDTNNRLSFSDVWGSVMPAVRSQADQKEVEQILDAEMNSGGSDDGDKMSALDYLMDAKDLLDGVFLKADEEEFRRVLYKIVDAERQIVEPIPEVRQQMRLKEAVRQYGIALKQKSYLNKDATEMVAQWLDCADDHIDKPEPMLPPDVEGWCLHRPTVFPDAQSPMPTWDSVLGRMDDPRAFAAWIWGIYMGEYEGRQILWVYGPHGEDGKSVFLKVIGEELFGPALGAIDNVQIKKKSGFLNSFFVNTKLVIYPDCKNKRVLMTEAFQSIANGGIDMVVVEPKGEKAYFSHLKARAAIASNYLPEITGDNFSTSRLLLIELDEAIEARTTPSEYGGALRKELPGFLAYAKSAYEELCPDNYKIRMNDAAKGNLIKSIGMFSEEHEYLFNKHFEYVEGHVLSGHEFYSEMREMIGMKNNNDISNFKAFLETDKGIIIERSDLGILYRNLALKGRTSTKSVPSINEEQLKGSEG